MVANEVANMVVDEVADMVVADMEVEKVADMEVNKKIADKVVGRFHAKKYDFEVTISELTFLV